MAYSSWTNSDWYVWYDVSSGNTQNDQVLAVWNKKDANESDPTYFTYEELSDIPSIVREKIDKKYHSHDLWKLYRCIEKFKDDVETERWIIPAKGETSKGDKG